MTNLRALFGLVVLGVMFAILMSAPLWAQQGSDSGTGFPEHGVFHGTSVESTQLNNGNSHIEIPLVHVAGRGGVAYYVKLMLDTKSMFKSFDHCGIPDRESTCSSTIRVVPHPELFVFDNFTSTAGSQDTVSIPTTCDIGFGGLGNGHNYRVSLTDPSGTKHQMLPLAISSNNDPCKLAPIVSQMYAADGSGWTLRVDPNTATILGAVAKDGTNLFQDANGNFLNTSAGSLTTVTDTAGRVLPRPAIVRDSSGNLQYQAVSYIDSSGQTQVIQVTYTTTTASTRLCPYTLYPVHCKEYVGSLLVPSQIIFPKNSGDMNNPTYTFSWSQNDFGEPLSLTLPEGGLISWTYGVLDSAGIRVATRTLSNGTTSGKWSYDYGTPANPGTIDARYPYTIITDPNGKATRHTCTYLSANAYDSNAPVVCHMTKMESFDGDVNAALLRSVQTDLSATFPYLPIRETTCLAQTNQCAKWEKDYDSFVVSTAPSFTTSFGNVIAFREFDFGTSSPGPLLRTTQSHFLYQDNANYLNTGLLDRPAYSKVYDGSGNIVAQTSFTYDGSPLTATSGVPGHDYTNFGANNPTRGNLTQVSHWRNTDGSWISTSHAYDDLGNLRSTTDPNGNATSFSYDDNWANTICVPAGVNTLVYGTQVTNALNQKTKAAYYPCTGLVQARQNQNDINAGRTGTTFTYDLLNRPLAVSNPDGGQTSLDYHGDALPLKVTRTVVATPNPSIIASTVYDPLGRVSRTSLDSDPEGVDYTDTTYDKLGRVATVSNLYRTTSDPMYGITQSQYDALDRVTQVTKQDGSISTVTYSGNCVTGTDEAGKARKACSDALGRLTQVWEDPAGLNYETDYQYDTLGNLLRVDQKGSASTDSSKWRTRLFTYNSLSQLLTANNPESGTISYAYDADGNLLQKTSPAPNQTGSATVTTTYSYDALHRVTQKSYSDITTPPAYYMFDVPSQWGLTITNVVGRLSEAYNFPGPGGGNRLQL